MDYGLKQALKVLIALACGVSVTAAIHGWDDCLC